MKSVINDAKELKFQDDVKEVQKMMKGFVKDGDPGIDELLNKTDKYGADVIAQAYVNVAKEIGGRCSPGFSGYGNGKRKIRKSLKNSNIFKAFVMSTKRFRYSYLQLH